MPFLDGSSIEVTTDKNIRLLGVESIDYALAFESGDVYGTGGKLTGFTPGISRGGTGSVTLWLETFDDWFDSVTGGIGGVVGAAIGGALASGLGGAGIGGIIGGAIAGGAQATPMDIFKRNQSDFIITLTKDHKQIPHIQRHKT